MMNSYTPSDHDSRIIYNMSQALLRDYNASKRAFGENFDSHMANLAKTVTDLQFESTHPDGCSFVSAALLMLSVDDEPGDDPAPEEFYRDIRSVIVWHSLERISESIDGIVKA